MTSDDDYDDLDPDDDMLAGESWARPRRTDRLSVLLVVALLVVAGFAAGVAVQKHHDAGLFPAGTAANRNRGGGVGPSGANAAAPGGRATDQPPVVTGTVGTITGDTLTVTDTGGAPATVHVPASATVTTTGLGGLRPGQPVSVSGTTGTDGTITATSVTAGQ